ncbi:hypothetical protein [Streptomyces sp. AK02-01A]|uniref:hypothetical protein n=1 Tax=Streptomyces sp. AK02-01A TaxID=3028648 RepID=UPI0029A213D2|nr:hypothetical protein [Streptomyces sp. AK02-01A]MDX3854863.1 hypothetical protein [Streptomyces sp. AK02-01A]
MTPTASWSATALSSASTGSVDDRADALERAEHLWTALHGIVAGRRRQGRYVWHRDVTDEVTGMVAIFAGARHGGSSAS